MIIASGNAFSMFEFMRGEFENINGKDNPYSSDLAMDMFNLGDMTIGESVYWFARRNGTDMTDDRGNSAKNAKFYLDVAGGNPKICGYEITRVDDYEWHVKSTFRMYNIKL